MAKSQFVILGDTYMSSGRFDEAYKYYLEAAIGEKDPDAIVKLAGMYLDDKYLRTDYEKAFRYFTMAYDLGLEPFKLMDKIVWNVNKLHDDETGSREYRKFLEHIYDVEVGYLNIWLADEHLNGVFGTDIDKFIKLCEKAGEVGESVGYDLLGELYFKGEHVKQDYEKAFKYFTENNGGASDTKLFYLSEMYRCGLYVEKDTEKAKEYCRELIDYLLDLDEDPSETMFYDKARLHLKELEAMNEGKEEN